MKRRFLKLAAVWTLPLVMGLSVNAAEYGVVYDESDALYSESLEALGTEILPEFTENYGIDFRVDVLTGIGNYENLEEAAFGLYEHYGYGSETEGNGVSLTILVHEDEDGYALDGWQVHFGGESEELTANAPAKIQLSADCFADTAWNGDVTQDAQALAEMITGFKAELEDFVLSGGVAETIWAPVEEEVITSLEEGNREPETSADNEWMTGEAGLDHVTDSYGLLTEDEWRKLETKAREIEQAYGFGVYVVTVDDFTSYSTLSVQDAAEAIYKKYSLGTGEEKNGVMLLLSMSERDYSLITHGRDGNYTFNDEGREYLTRFFLDDFAENEWYQGFADYLSWSERYLETANKNQPYSYDNQPMTESERLTAIMMRVGAILLVPLVIAAIYISVLTSKMKSVAEATKATAYMAGNLNLTKQTDRFTHVTETKTKIERDDDSGSRSSGGSRSGSSSGFSGTSGKF